MKSQRPHLYQVEFWNTVAAFVLTGAAFSVFFQQSPGGCGDYPQNFEVLYFGMGAGLAGAILFLALYPLIPHPWTGTSILVTIIRLYLASVLFSYGFSKVFASQFPHLMANMDARMIELTPMRVAWAFFGYSREYQMFLGWGEVIPAALLLFRRTMLIGSILMFAVMLNVFLINIFFDVCVKLNSGIYTVLALYLMLQETGRLWKFFFANQPVPGRVGRMDELPKRWRITGYVLYALALGYVVWTAGQYVVQVYGYASTQKAVTEVEGAWRASSITDLTASQPTAKNPTDSLCANRVFFDGYNGVIQSQWVRDRFRFSILPDSGRLTVTFTNNRNEWNTAAVTWLYEMKHPDSLLVTGRWRTDSVRLVLVKRKEKLTRY